MPPGKSQDVLCLFCSFSKYVKNRRFCAEFGQKCALKKKKKKKTKQKRLWFLSFLIFIVLFCCFCRIWLTKCPQTENKKEQKRSCRRKNRKMSFVFFVVGPPPPYLCVKLVHVETELIGKLDLFLSILRLIRFQN